MAASRLPTDGSCAEVIAAAELVEKEQRSDTATVLASCLPLLMLRLQATAARTSRAPR